MSGEDSRPEPEREAAGTPTPGGEAVPAEAPASTTDFRRFPEREETGEITSFLAPAGPAARGAPAAKAVKEGPPETPEPTSFPPELEAQIEFLGRLGAGGMGEVFRGRQKQLGRLVAVKRIHHWGADAATRERFLHEAKAQSRLQHPGIAQVYDLREAAGALYLVMELVEGRTLEEILATEGKRPPAELIAIALQLCEALEAAAREGYIHRDLKPANVMLSGEAGGGGRRVKIIDFGLAFKLRRLLAGAPDVEASWSEQDRFTKKGELLGTPAFMAPEQLSEEGELDVRVDIWALGVLLYTVATGEPPFSGRDFVCTVKNVLLSEPVPLPTLEEGFPQGLWELIAKCLRKDPSERFQDHAALREALLAVRAAGEAPPARAASKPRRALVGLSLAAVLGLAAFGLRFLPKATEPSAATPVAAAPRPDLKELPTPEQPRPERAIELPPKLPPDAAAPSLAVPAAPREAALPLREKLAGYALSEEELGFVKEVLGLFETEHPRLLAKDFGTLEGKLEALGRERLGLLRGAAAEPGKLYRAAQWEGALRLMALARGALRARLEELRGSKEPVTLELVDGSSVRGVLSALGVDWLRLAAAGGAETEIPLSSLRAESLRGQAAPGSAFLALLLLSGDLEATIPELMGLAESREELLYWIPPVLRLARLAVEAEALGFASAGAEGQPLRRRAEMSLIAARVAGLARRLAEQEAAVLRMFPHLKPEFELASRAAKGVALLEAEDLAGVLALGPGHPAYGAAAGILMARFEAGIASGADELLAGSGWHAYGWRLFPEAGSLKEQQRSWDLDPDGKGSVLQAEGEERRLSMGKGAGRAPEGLLLEVGFVPSVPASGRSQWRFLLRRRDGAAGYLRFDARSCVHVLGRLEPGAADVELARAPLPALREGAGERRLVLLPVGSRLLVLVDGEPMLFLPEAEARIPQQLSFAVTQGRLALRSLKLKKASADADR